MHTNKDGMWTSEDAQENFVNCNVRFNDAFVISYVSYVLTLSSFLILQEKWRRHSCSMTPKQDSDYPVG